MKKWLPIIFLCLFSGIPAMLTAQEETAHAIREQEARLAEDPDNTEALRKLLFLNLHKADYRKAVEYGDRLLDIGYARKDYGNEVVYAHTGLGQAYTMLGDSIIAYGHLGQARTNAESAHNDSALCSVYNGWGLYAINITNDHYSALHYFFMGLDAAKRSRHDELHAILLGNISAVYYLKRDTVGLTYSLEAYDVGHRQANPYLIYIGAMTSAYMYYLRGECETALPYIKEAEFLALQNKFRNVGDVYAVYGKILTEQGRTSDAIQLFRKGLSLVEEDQTSARVSLLHGYARALRKERRYAQAADVLKEALTIAGHDANGIYNSDIIDELSSCYADMGDYATALTWLRRLHQENDSLYNTDKERIISDLRIKYDTERMENKVQQSNLRLLQKEKNELLLGGILLLVLVSSALLWHQYRKKNRLYRSIVLQNQEALRREQSLQAAINDLQQAQSEKRPAPSLNEEKKASLFQQLEQLMRDRSIYRDNQLTKDKAAELLGTNRTYLSQTINEQTGQTFTQYVNQYRLNEAIRLLNDPEQDIPLKVIASEVGFSSMTTFYKVFQASVGMPPKQYRETAMKLHRKV